MVRHTTQRAKKKFFCFRERGGHGGLVPFVSPLKFHETITTTNVHEYGKEETRRNG